MLFEKGVKSNPCLVVEEKIKEHWKHRCFYDVFEIFDMHPLSFWREFALSNSLMSSLSSLKGKI